MSVKISIKQLIFLLMLSFSLSSYGLELKWAGCGITKKAFMAELASAYERKTGIKIELEGGGATKGIQKVISKSVDVGGSCRFRVNDDDASRASIKFNPVAWDALTVVVNQANQIDSISLESLRDIYTGKINNWSQLGGSDQPLDLYVREGKISGVGHTIRQLLFNNPQMSFEGSAFFPSSGPLEKAIEKNPNAIGMTGISSARKRNFKILKLDGKEPSFENIKNGSYTLYRPLYIISNRESDNYAEVKRFLSFTHSREGRDIMRDNGVVPYLEAVWLSSNLQRQWSDSRKIRN
ncbi:MAG: phosphate ABC transporter substrate-binding protein [Candidatus Thiodiazotropha weberae]|nr:phosphate ABC transporter substrate-binding protein [Candidatus Thiodiazotropha endoloripes]MCG7900573.1 phosphate ABC transporter substrate-binding protein [Candidatus Thiodiazotropha weberae]